MQTETTDVESLAERLAPALLTYLTRRVPDASDAADLLAETLRPQPLPPRPATTP